MGSHPDPVRQYNRHLVFSLYESRTKNHQANTIDRFLTKSLGQVSLLSETVQTMCNEQFGTWKIGVVDVIALVGACLDVFWFDPLQMIHIPWRGGETGSLRDCSASYHPNVWDTQFS